MENGYTDSCFYCRAFILLLRMKQLIIIASILAIFSLSIVCNPGNSERKSTWTADNFDTTNVYALDQRDSVIQGTDTVGLDWRPFEWSPYKIVQEVVNLEDGRGVLITTAWHGGEIIYRSHISEHPTGKEVWHKGDLWFVPNITQEVKKAEHERAQRASDEYLEKIKPYEP